MAEGENDDDKQYAPSQKKLDDARKKGELPRSVDLVTAASYAGFLIACFVFGSRSLIEFGTAFQKILENADVLSRVWFKDAGMASARGQFAPVFGASLPWFAVPAISALACVVATRSLVFAPEKITPKLNKISPVANAKNKYGRSGIFEFAKSFAKLAIYSVVLGYYVLAQLPEILTTMTYSVGMVTVTLLKLCIGFMAIVLAISIVIGGVDFVFQYTEHIRKHRMSRKDMTDEAKDQEGDPHAKQKRRQKGQEIALNQMLKDVPKADVVIVNPTHFAVALKWDRASGGAPICVAKGVDEVAAQIRNIANENGVPIHRDPPTARLIYAHVELGHEVWPEHYPVVAAAIRFAESMRQKSKMRLGRNR